MSICVVAFVFGGTSALPLSWKLIDSATHFDDPNELLDEWLTEDEEEWATPELEERIRSSTAPVDVVDRLVFNLYRSEPLAPTS